MKHLVVVFFILLLTTSLAWGKGVLSGLADVSAGSHNFSGVVAGQVSPTPGPSEYQTSEDEICVFCHTPHGGTLDAPLWNRSSPELLSTWSHYNSPTMSIELKTYSTSRAPNAESLVCLSCHDGSVAINHVINLPNDRAGAAILGPGGVGFMEIVPFFGNPGARIGGEPGTNDDGTGFLSDDHPISFSYFDVETSAEYQGAGPKAGTLHPTNVAIANGVQFFTSNANLECSSCHDPHVDYITNDAYDPFLIMPNDGSALCLACHIK